MEECFYSINSSGCWTVNDRSRLVGGRKEKFITGRNIDEGFGCGEVGSEAGGSGLH